MPKFLERDLQTEAAKQGKSGRAADRYVYGAMNNMGAMQGNQETPKGRAMEAKHDADMGKDAANQHMTKALHHALGLAHHLTKLRKLGHLKGS